MSISRRAQPKKFVPSQSGLVDFEPCSIEEARAALDEADAAMASLVSPAYWAKVRRQPSAKDRALTGQSLTWLAKMPEEVRPNMTVQRYPRVINALVEVWGDRDERNQAFENLLNDDRPGRRGFPLDVERELSTLWLYSSALPR